MSIDFKALLREERSKALLERSASPLREERAKASLECSAPLWSDNHTVTISSKGCNIENEESCCESSHPHVMFSFKRVENVQQFEIGSIPSIAYIPSFCSVDEEALMLKIIQEEGLNGAWQTLRSRRLQCWDIACSTKKSACGWLEAIISSICESCIFGEDDIPNHVLINEYTKDEGIMHHVDGPKYLDKVVILSLESECLITFRKNLEPCQIGVEYGGDLFSLLLQPRSLLVFCKDVYRDYMHGIAASQDMEVVGGNGVVCLNSHICGVEDGHEIIRARRTSLTIRKKFPE